MKAKAIKAVWTALFAVVSAIFIGLGTNWQIGVGVFYGLWFIAGIMELTND